MYTIRTMKLNEVKQAPLSHVSYRHLDSKLDL